MKFSGKAGNGSANKWLNFGGDPNHGSGSGSVRALAEVCTVPVLLVQESVHNCSVVFYRNFVQFGSQLIILSRSLKLRNIIAAFYFLQRYFSLCPQDDIFDFFARPTMLLLTLYRLL